MGGGALNTMRCAMCHQKDPHFLSLTQWPLGLCIATHRPLSSVTQRPPISDLSPKDPQFLILSPQTHHFNYLAQTSISHNNWSQDFKGFIACGQLDVLYSINTLTERPRNLWSVTERPLFFGCSCHPQGIFSYTAVQSFRNYRPGAK